MTMVQMQRMMKRWERHRQTTDQRACHLSDI